MRALLIGGAGYVGSAVASSLILSGWEVFAVDALYTGNAKSLPPTVKLTRCDCGIAVSVEEVIGKTKFDVAISLTALGANLRSRELTFHYYHNNFIATYYLLQTMVKNRLRKFIFSSDFSIYGAAAQCPIDSSSAKNPCDPLGRSIHAVEMLLEDLAMNCDLDYATVRFGHVGGAIDGGPAGPSLPDGSSRLLSDAFAAALGKRDSVQIAAGKFQTADGSAAIDILHVADVADAYVKIADELTRRRGGREFILASGEPITVLKVIETVAAVTGREIATNQTDQSSFFHDSHWGNPSETRAALAWRHRRDIRQIVESEWNALNRKSE
ncbi:MAG: NAD-dependent epimerase/dehydratase family protein [Puniceicoccales bacterium]|nr:NAD-dependent epimerase/dehydratase family protein [Puniceicoccales bacterium]